MHLYFLNFCKMKNKILYITLLIFSICFLVVLYRWIDTDSGLSAEKSSSYNTISKPSADSIVLIQQFSIPLKHLAVDTSIVYSSSDIAYSDFVALNLDTTSYYNVKHITFSVFCIRMSADSLEYFHINQMRISPRQTDGHASPTDYTLYIEQSPYKVKDNTIYVQGYRIKILNDQKLEVLDLPKIPSGTFLYCSKRFFYDSKKLKYWGIWVDGKKHEEWFYVDEKKNVVREFYDHGNLIERNVNHNQSWRQRIIFEKEKFSFVQW